MWYEEPQLSCKFSKHGDAHLKIILSHTTCNQYVLGWHNLSVSGVSFKIPVISEIITK